MNDIAGKLPTKEDFSAALDSLFHARAPDGPGFDLCLVGFEDLVSNAIQENFSLLFRAPVDAPPFQNIYRLEHEALEKMDLFLVPVRKDENGLYYEAVFNQFIESKV